jgi:multidrug efflux pump
MAITIMGGLLVATVLTLVVVPALYALWFRVPVDERADTPAVSHAEPSDRDYFPVGIAAE